MHFFGIFALFKAKCLRDPFNFLTFHDLRNVHNVNNAIFNICQIMKFLFFFISPYFDIILSKITESYIRSLVDEIPALTFQILMPFQVDT